MAALGAAAPGTPHAETATSTPSSLFFSGEVAATSGAVRHRRGESVEKSVSGLEANSSIESFSPAGGLETDLRAAREPRATSSGCGEAEPFEPWTSPTAGSEQRRLARMEPARASIQAPPPGKGAVGSGGEKEEDEVEVDVGDGDGDGDGASATGLDEIEACFCFQKRVSGIRNGSFFSLTNEYWRIEP